MNSTLLASVSILQYFHGLWVGLSLGFISYKIFENFVRHEFRISRGKNLGGLGSDWSAGGLGYRVLRERCSGLRNLPCQSYRFRTAYTVHYVVYITIRCVRYNILCKVPYDVYGTLCCVQYNLLCTVQYVVYSTIYCVHYNVVYTVHYVVYSTICCVRYNIMCTVQYVVYGTLCCAQYTVLCTVQYIVYSTICCVRSWRNYKWSGKGG